MYVYVHVVKDTNKSQKTNTLTLNIIFKTFMFIEQVKEFKGLDHVTNPYLYSHRIIKVLKALKSGKQPCYHVFWNRCVKISFWSTIEFQ